MKTLFLNFTQHSLTQQQEKAAKELGASEIKSWKDVISKRLHSQLQQSPDNLQDIENLVSTVILDINKIAEDYDHVFLHLPIGSPAFQCAFSRAANQLKTNVSIVFSHSKRFTKEENGKKVTKFKFEKFILF